MTDERAPEGAPEPNPEPAGEAPVAEDAKAAEEATSPAMPAYTPPAYTPPPVPPPAMPQPAMAQPAVAWAAPPAAAAVQGSRTTLALGAGVLMLILGILFGLLGLAIAVLGPTFASAFENMAEFPDMNGADPGAVIGGVFAFIGIIIVVYSLVYIAGGIGVMRSRGWGRVIGIIVGILSGLIWLSSLTNAGRVSEAGGAAGGGAFALVLLVIHIYIVVTLLFFWRRRASTA